MEATLTARLWPAAASRAVEISQNWLFTILGTGATHDGDFSGASIDPNAAMTRLTGQL